MAEERKTRQRNSNRKRRTGFGGRKLKMNLDSETESKLKADDRVARWFNDVDDRIKRALEADWDFVNYDNVEVGDNKEAQSDDTRVKRQVGRGVYAYLMSIPREFYEEDQARKEEHNRMVDEAIQGGQPPGSAPPNVGAGGGTYKGNINYKP